MESPALTLAVHIVCTCPVLLVYLYQHYHLGAQLLWTIVVFAGIILSSLAGAEDAYIEVFETM